MECLGSIPLPPRPPLTGRSASLHPSPMDTVSSQLLPQPALSPEPEAQGIPGLHIARFILDLVAGAIPSPVITIVGGGGKTSTLFALSAALADAGLETALTTTTHIRDPRKETGRRFDRVIMDSRLGAAPELGLTGRVDPGFGPDAEFNAIPDETVGIPRSLEPDRQNSDPCRPAPWAGHNAKNRASIPAGTITVFFADLAKEEEARGLGLHPDQVAILLRSYDAVVIEADGSRGLPIKAPAGHEPVIPACTGLVIGVTGLDCLGKPMDGATVHRPELFSRVTGCASGEPIGVRHILELARSPTGIFKGSPPGAMRILLLNKADILDAESLAGLSRSIQEVLREEPAPTAVSQAPDFPGIVADPQPLTAGSRLPDAILLCSLARDRLIAAYGRLAGRGTDTASSPSLIIHECGSSIPPGTMRI